MNSNNFENTSHTLIARVVQQDKSAWVRFVNLYTRLVYSWCRQSGIKPADVHDVAQEVFLAVHNSIHTFDAGKKETGAFRCWLWGITKHKICDHFNHLKNHNSAHGGTDAHKMLLQIQEIEGEPETVDGVKPHQILLESAFEILQKDFDKDTWECFRRIAVSGDTAQDIGASLGLTANAVRQRKYRVMQKLRELLPDDFPELLKQYDDS